MREEFPIVVKPDVDPSDFTFWKFDSEQLLGNMPVWFCRWSHMDDLDANIDSLRQLYGCAVISKFTAELFSQATPEGVLYCSRITEREDNRYWLVLRNTAAGSPIPESPSQLLFSNVRDYFFLREPETRVTLKQLDGVGIKSEGNLVNRFFLTYGGLRDSSPHFGGDCFSMYPQKVPGEVIESRINVQHEWLNSAKFHTRGNCDYLLLSETGKVGYVPIEIERNIETYANNFGSAVLKWVRESPRA